MESELGREACEGSGDWGMGTVWRHPGLAVPKDLMSRVLRATKQVSRKGGAAVRGRSDCRCYLRGQSPGHNQSPQHGLQRRRGP